MGRFRRMIGFAGIMAGGLMAGEQPASAQQPRTPERLVQAEKAPFTPRAGFDNLLKEFASRAGTATMQTAKERADLAKATAQRYLDDAKGDKQNDSYRNFEGIAQARAIQFEMLALVQEELRLQEEYKANKSGNSRGSLDNNANKLWVRFYPEKSKRNKMDDWDRRRIRTKAEWDSEERSFYRDMSGFLEAVQTFVEAERAYYNSNLRSLDYDPPANDPRLR